MATSIPNFNFLALIVSEIKRVSQNLMWGYYPPAVLKLLCVLQVLGKVKQPARFQHRISMHHAVMRICISHRLSIVHCGLKKNAPTLADYNYDPVQSILIIFSRLFGNDHRSCLVVKFSTSPHICCHYTL